MNIFLFLIIVCIHIFFNWTQFGIEIEKNILILIKSRVINIVAGPLAKKVNNILKKITNIKVNIITTPIITPITCTDMKPTTTLNQPRIKPAVRKLKQKHFETIGIAIPNRNISWATKFVYY